MDYTWKEPVYFPLSKIRANPGKKGFSVNTSDEFGKKIVPVIRLTLPIPEMELGIRFVPNAIAIRNGGERKPPIRIQKVIIQIEM